MRESVSINFKRPFPLFPLPETPLLPHTIVPLAVSEPRFCQLVDHALDGKGQVAIATLEATDDSEPLSQTPNVRPAICLGQIVQHDTSSYGYNILVYGLCRATLKSVNDPSAECEYSRVIIKPTESSRKANVEHRRVELQKILQRPNLQRLERLEALEYWMAQDEITTPALFELIGGSLLDDAEFRYELLAEPSCDRRTIRILSELRHIDWLLSVSNGQSQNLWEKGVSWN